MICNKCGSNVSESLRFCPVCGNSFNNEQVFNIDNNLNNNNFNNGINNNEDNNDLMTPNNKNINYKFIIIGVIVVLVISGIFFVVKGNKKTKDSNSQVKSDSNITSNSNTTSNQTSNNTSNITSNQTSNNTSNATSNTATNNVAKFGGFAFNIPSAYTVSANTSQLVLMGTNNINVASINIIDGSYDDLKKNNKTLVNQMKSQGYTIGSIKNRKYNKVEFIIIPVAQNNQYMVMAYAKLTNKKIIILACANTNNKLDYSELPLFAQMIATAKVAK